MPYTQDELLEIRDLILEHRAICKRLSKTGFGKIPENTFDNLIIRQYFNIDKINWE